MLNNLLNKPTTMREWLDPRHDVSVWQAIARAVRRPYRRHFHPNGPAWFGQRISCVQLIMALQGCSRSDAEKAQRALDRSRLTTWLEGY